MTKSAHIIRMTNWANTRITGPIQKNKANMKMTSFDVLFQKKMAAMFSSVSPLQNCSCIYNIKHKTYTAVAFIEVEIIVNSYR